MLHTMRSLGRLSNTLEDVYETQIQTLAMYVLRTTQRATFKAMRGGNTTRLNLYLNI
jgi:hypothetical protein